MFRLLSILFLFFWTAPVWAENSKIEFAGPDPLTIVTSNGQFEFQVEIADTPERRSRGLMFRETMDMRHGMLFQFGKVQTVAMWMKNTPLSLDMIFINPDGSVRTVVKRTTPLSEAVITSGGPVSHVLEVNAGVSTLIGLKPGDVVRHRFFGSTAQ